MSFASLCLVTLSIALGACGAASRSPSPSSSPPARQVPVAETAPVAGDEPGGSHVVLDDTPTQRQLAWVIDVLAQHGGVIDEPEIDEHWASMNKPMRIRTLLDGFRRWNGGATSAFVDKIEVNDPAYLRAHVTVGGKRYRVVLTLDETSKKIDFIQWDDEK